jgi:hypothetical protein
MIPDESPSPQDGYISVKAEDGSTPDLDTRVERQVFSVRVRKGETSEETKARIAGNHPVRQLGYFWMDGGFYEDGKELDRLDD